MNLNRNHTYKNIREFDETNHTGNYQYIGKTEYKYVYKSIDPYGCVLYNVRMSKQKVNKYFYKIKEAGLFVDKILIKDGQEPVNILKKK